jgi:hypothetical protein
MIYRVAFTKRVESDGADSGMQPSAELDQNLSDGVVADKVFVEELESDAQHSQEVLDEDDAFLGSAATEVWDYRVVDDRAREFEQGLQNSDLVLEYDIIDLELTSRDDASLTTAGASRVYPTDGGNDARDVTSRGSGVRAGDDGPAGMPTGPASDLGPGDSVDDLNVTSADDPRLGLTNRPGKPAKDWAADTGPTRNPNRENTA